MKKRRFEMGTIQHESILMMAFGQEAEDLLYEKACELGLEDHILIGDPVHNGYRPVVIIPDGSKEGWEDSDEMQENRNNFVSWLKSLTYPVCDWCRVEWGDLREGVETAFGETQFDRESEVKKQLHSVEGEDLK
jgi:hypothetical protein